MSAAPRSPRASPASPRAPTARGEGRCEGALAPALERAHHAGPVPDRVPERAEPDPAPRPNPLPARGKRGSAAHPPPPVHVVTLGCRLNAYESEAVRRHAEAAGLDNTVIVNTCAVTAEAVRQAGQTIRRLRRERPGARIVVTGCAAQVEPQRFAAMPEVSAVVGNAEKMRTETFHGLGLADSPRVVVNDIMSVTETASAMIDGFGSRARAYMQIQNGCDHRCTFCIIPFGRGPSRSVPAGEVVGQARRLVEAGYPEIVLTGIDITAYGLDLPGGMRLGKLVRHILRHVPDLKRLRLSSIDQVEADRDLIDAFAEEPRLMPHLHLSLQSGDDMVLKRMKRRHTRAEAIAFCAEVRRLRPDVAFGADLIAGFPTETEAMFDGSMRIVDECGLAFLHVFPYSPRPGTPAARMPPVAGATVKERAARLRQKGQLGLARYLAAQVGREAEVLVERPGLGRTASFAEVEIAPDLAGAGAPLAGELVTVCVTGTVGSRLRGEPATPKCAP